MAADTIAVLDGFRRVLQALREGARQAEAGLKISGAQLFVLQVVAQTPGLSLNELAAHTRTHQSSVSVVVARLVDAGLLRRERAPDDARRMVLTSTAKSRRLLTKAPDVPQRRLIAAVEALPKSQHAMLARSLRAIGAAMEVDGAPPMFFESPAKKRRGDRRHRYAQATEERQRA